MVMDEGMVVSCSCMTSDELCRSTESPFYLGRSSLSSLLFLAVSVASVAFLFLPLSFCVDVFLPLPRYL